MGFDDGPRTIRANVATTPAPVSRIAILRYHPAPEDPGARDRGPGRGQRVGPRRFFARRLLVCKGLKFGERLAVGRSVGAVEQ
jgi:hypothetical protein